MHRTVFNAVILAAQPMTFSELLDFLSIKIGEEPSSRRRRTRSVVLSACSPFVEVDYDSDLVNPTVRLAHKSIGDLLAQDPTKLDFVAKDCYKFFVNHRQGGKDIGRRCLTYLSYKRYSGSDFVDPEDSTTNGLLKYASVFWYKHLQDAGPSRELFEQMRDFLKSPNFWTCIRVQSKYAPHAFAKLSYNSKTDFYKMHISNGRTAAVDSAEEFYADALPPWIGEYDNQGDNLVWAYHMFVREWGAILVRKPDEIQTYFAGILGERSFFHKGISVDKKVKVTAVDGSNTLQQILHPYHLNEVSTTTVQPAKSSEKPMIESIEGISPYIKDVLKNNHGEWKLDHSTTVQHEGITATIHRYNASSTVSEDEEDGSDDESSDEAEPLPEMARDPAIFFLSIAHQGEVTKWFHRIMKSGLLQRSPPFFIPHTSWLLWPQDESSITVISLLTWKCSLTDLPKSGGTDGLLVCQGKYFP